MLSRERILGKAAALKKTATLIKLEVNRVCFEPHLFCDNLELITRRVNAGGTQLK